MPINLFPKDEVFFRLFQDQARRIEQAASMYHDLVQNFTDVPTKVQAIRDIESEGDEKTRELLYRLNKSFVTPVDREDIHTLAMYLDDVLDLIQATVVRMKLYEVDTPLPPAIQGLAELSTRCAEVLREGFDRMPKFEDLSELYKKMHALEIEGDGIHREAVAELFRNAKEVADVVRLLKWKEILKTAEDTIDKFKDVFELLQEVVIKHA